MQKMTFFKKKLKTTVFFSPLVSDHVVTLNCFTVRAHFFDFPIDFFWSLSPSLYADEVLCAAFRAARTPPYSIRVAQNSKNGETLYKFTKHFLYDTGPQKLSSGAGERYIFMFFIFSFYFPVENLLFATFAIHGLSQYYIIVVFPTEIPTFCNIHGSVIFGCDLFLLRVLASNSLTVTQELRVLVGLKGVAWGRSYSALPPSVCDRCLLYVYCFFNNFLKIIKIIQ